MTPFFSIIIPTYNRAHLIAVAIKSVLAQSYTDWELLIIDDGSTDNTKDVVTAFADKRIRYIFQQNAERCAARNNGIRQSHGQYITFLDSDDYYLPNRLQLLHTELVKRNLPESFFYTGLQLFDEDTGKRDNKEVSVLSSNKFDNVVLSTIHSQQVCAHRNIFNGHLFNVALSVGEDTELWLRIATDYEPIPIKGQCTVVVVEHSGRSINVKNNNPFVKQEITLDTIFNNPDTGGKISDQTKNLLYSNNYFGCARHYIYKRQTLKALYWLLKAILIMPGHKQTKYRLNIIRYLLTDAAKAEQLLQN